jgi:hypothetical protein
MTVTTVLFTFIVLLICIVNGLSSGSMAWAIATIGWGFLFVRGMIDLMEEERKRNE